MVEQPKPPEHHEGHAPKLYTLAALALTERPGSPLVREILESVVRGRIARVSDTGRVFIEEPP